MHEFVVGLFGRIQIDCTDDLGETLGDGIVASLRDAGITAQAETTEADYGPVAGDPGRRQAPPRADPRTRIEHHEGPARGAVRQTRLPQPRHRPAARSSSRTAVTGCRRAALARGP
jgi:hypothetical protein